ncbi:PDR/VanB family oxidoreductase [Pseudomonas triticicola]|uniref:PDR/VanB family oxidoreductase n=1 Tax=Pseudomonas triticicola TaxID=2842345 RepID=UPI003EBCCE7F
MLNVIVTGKTREAEGICCFELSATDGTALPAFEAGAHIDVHLPGGLVRQYSLCNDPSERHRYRISVLKDPQSRGGSQAMHEQILTGQTLTISAPRNLFMLEPCASGHLLFAGGIGITPMLAMAYTLAQQDVPFELHYCFRSSDRAAFLPLLTQAPFAERVILHDDSGPQEQKFDAASLLASPGNGSHLYVCGPSGFMNHVIGTAQLAGWPEHRIHREFFAAAPINHSADTAFEVELARSGQIFQIPADRSVFEVLDEAGVAIDSSCEQGICGSCVTRVLSGIPEHRDQFLSAAEQAANDQFTPCCSRARTSRLVLDL